MFVEGAAEVVTRMPFAIRLFAGLWLALAVCAPLSAQDVEVIEDVVYGHTDGLAAVYDVAVPAEQNGTAVVFVVSGGFLSNLEQQAYILPVAKPLLDAGFTVFHLRHPSTPRYTAPEIVKWVRQGVDHIVEHAEEYGVDGDNLGIMGMSTGGLLALMPALDPQGTERVAPVAGAQRS